jgi:serine/threonine-protein kinase
MPGRPLDRVLATGPLPVPVVLAILAQVGAALDHAHSRGVIHRDIKPANIMLDEDGQAIVADFGIAKVAQGTGLTQTGSTVGTPTYMSPEQCTGKPVTGASDQYALGCVAFELLTGRAPFVHEEVVPVLLSHVSDPPPPLLPLRPDCTLPLAEAVERMLAKQPDERWPSVAEAITAAEALLPSDPQLRAALRALAQAPRGSPVFHLPSVPLSPVPAKRAFSNAGVITGLSEGVAEISARCEQAGAVVQVRVARVPVAQLRLTHPEGPWQIGERRRITVAVLDQAGTVLSGRQVQWTTLDPTLVTVEADGMVQGRAEGVARIRASCEAQSSELTLEVRATPGILTIVPSGGSMATGQVVRLAALWQLTSGETRAVPGASWESSDAGVLRVTSEGDLAAIRPGTARIQLCHGGRVAEATYQVTRVDVASVRILPRASVLGVGEEMRLQAQATDRLGSSLPGRVVTWASSHTEVAVVEPDGRLCGIGPGTARISASIGAGLASFEVKISPVAPAAIRIEPSALVLLAGELAQLKASVQSVRGGLLPGFPIEWVSSEPTIAIVDAVGMVTGLRFGNARIAASAGGRRATVPVEVRPTVTTSGSRNRGGA